MYVSKPSHLFYPKKLSETRRKILVLYKYSKFPGNKFLKFPTLKIFNIILLCNSKYKKNYVHNK